MATEVVSERITRHLGLGKTILVIAGGWVEESQHGGRLSSLPASRP